MYRPTTKPKGKKTKPVYIEFDPDQVQTTISKD